MTVMQSETDPVIHPPYYMGAGGLEVIDVIDRFDLTYYEGTIIAYIVRARHKGGLTDLVKAEYLLRRLIANVQAEKERAARHAESRQHDGGRGHDGQGRPGDQ